MIEMSNKVTLRYAIEDDLKGNDYLKDLHQKLLKAYASQIFNAPSQLSTKEVQDLLVFSDLMSKTKNIDLEQASLEIVTCLNKMFPDSHSIKFYKNRIFEELGNYSRSEQEKFEEEKSVNALINRIRKTNEQTLRKLPTEDGYFIGEQKDLYDLISGRLNSFSAPTSMGKSFLMKMFIEEKVRAFEKLNFVYLVPTKALITEVTSDLCSKLGRELQLKGYRIVNHFDSIGTRDQFTNLIYVLTPERFEYLLMRGFSKPIDYLFIDEAQNISKEDSRSTVYYRIFDLLKRQNLDPRITFAAPLIDNPQIYEALSDLEYGSSLKANLSPVSQIYFLLNGRKIEIYDRLTSDFFAIQYPTNLGTNNLLIGLLKSLPGQNLVYRNSINNVVNGAKLWSHSRDVLNEQKNLSISSYIADRVHPDYYLSEIIMNRTAYHFGKIPDEVRGNIERAFCKGKIDTLFCTSTLMEGVNLPADNIVIDSTKIGKKDMNSIQFKNLTGRVGRLSNSMLGNILLIANSKRSYNKFKSLVTSKKLTAKLSLESLVNSKILENINKDLKSGDITLTSVRNEVQNPRKFATIRKFSLIYLNNLQSDRDSIITKRFNTKITSDDQEMIKEKFQEQYGDQTEEDVNFSADQSIELREKIRSSTIDYPQIVDDNNQPNIEETYKFLMELGNIFKWSKYETEIYPPVQNMVVLKDYAELLIHWMRGDLMPQLCDFVIQRRGRDFDFLDRSQEIRNRLGINSRFGMDKSMDETNLSIQVLLEALSKIQFKFSKYFLKFSRTLIEERQIDELDNDWYQYLEYGTTDESVIWLEQLGYSRSNAIEIVTNKIEAIVTDSQGDKLVLKLIHEMHNPEIERETERIMMNYPDSFVYEG